MLKITMPKNYKDLFTLSDLETIKQIKEDNKELLDNKVIKDDLQSALSFATGYNGFEILKTDYEFCLNSAFSGYETQRYNNYGRRICVDIWCTVYAFDAYFGFVCLGFPLFNFYQRCEDNEEEIKNNMLIDIYKKTK